MLGVPRSAWATLRFQCRPSPRRWVEVKFESGHSGAVDHAAGLEHGVFIGSREVEIGREAAIISGPALAKARTALEQQGLVCETTCRHEQKQQVIFRDVEQCRVVGVGAARGVTGHQRSGQRHGLCLSHESLERSDQPVEHVVLRHPERLLFLGGRNVWMFEPRFRH